MYGENLKFQARKGSMNPMRYVVKLITSLCIYKNINENMMIVVFTKSF